MEEMRSDDRQWEILSRIEAKLDLMGTRVTVLEAHKAEVRLELQDERLRKVETRIAQILVFGGVGSLVFPILMQAILKKFGW
jgi:hypothetical protein